MACDRAGSVTDARCPTPGRRLPRRTGSARARRSPAWPRRARPPGPISSKQRQRPARPSPRRGVALELVAGPLKRSGARASSARRTPACAGRRTRSGPGALALRLHRRLEARRGRAPAALRPVLDEVHRQPVGVVEPEHLVAGDHAARRPTRSSSSSSRGSPAVSTASNRSSSLATTLRHVRVAGPRAPGRHRPSGRRARRRAVEERLRQPEAVAVTHRAPHDLAEHVAAPLVGRHDAVGDQERHGPRVVGDDAHRDVGRRPSCRA